MGAYTIIADISRSMLELLKSNLVPEPVKKAEDIGVCAPNDRGNHILGLYLYDIDENPESRSMERIVLDKEHYKEAPMSINLYYMLFAYSDTDLTTRAIDEQRILGKAIQALREDGQIAKEYLVGTLKENEEIVPVHMVNMSLEEKVRIWSLFNEPYRISTFYKVGPIFLESDKIKALHRVQKVDISVHQK